MDRVRPKSSASAVKKYLAIGAVALTLIVSGVALANIDFSTYRVDRSTVSIAAVQQGTLEVKVTANGRLESRSIEQLAAQVGGRVAKQHVKPGAVVAAGDVLLELTNPQVIASAEEARSAWEGSLAELKALEADLHTGMLNQQIELTRVEFELEAARARFEAEEKIKGQNIVSALDHQRTELNVRQLERIRVIETDRLQKIRDNIDVQLSVAQARVSQLERALERAENDVESLRITAGISGIVQSIDVDVGQQLQPGSAIGLVAEQDQLYAELRVPAREATEVQTGQPAVIDTRRGTVEGEVVRVDPGVTDGTVIVDVELRGEPPSGARPQLQVEGIIFLTQIPDTLYVTKPAYVKADSAISVYRVEGDYAQRHTIEVGEVSLNHIQVLGGLQAGDRIVTSEIGEWRNESRVLLK